MKNGDAILAAAKVLARELSIGMKEEMEGLRGVANKAKESYKDGTLAKNVKERVEKEKAAAEVVLSAQMENIGKEVQKIREQLEQLQKKTPAEEDIVDAAPAEEAPAEEAECCCKEAPAEAAECCSEEAPAEAAECCCEEAPAEAAECCCEEAPAEAAECCCEEAPAEECACEAAPAPCCEDGCACEKPAEE